MVEEGMQQPNPILERSTALYENHAPAVLAYLLRQLGSREDAEDVLLEVFTVILEKKGTLLPDERSVRAWILAIARNKVVDHYRRAQRFPRVPLPNVEEWLYEREDREPEQQLLRQEASQQLQISVQTLSMVQQEILQLRFGEDLRCAEIAQVVSKSERAVRSLLYRALKQLRGLYDHERAERSF
jgi:RNA polymerase sigma-70 factor (ECF subfamily)